LPALIGDVEIHQIAPEGSQYPSVDHLHQAVEVFEAVLQRCATEYEDVTKRDALDGGGDLGAPILDPLGLVQDQEIRGQGFVDRTQIP